MTAQNRIAKEIDLAQAEIKRAEATDSPYGQLLETALGIMRDAREGYSAADPYVKRLWNRALVERIEIGAGQIARVELKEPFAGLFLWAGSNKGRLVGEARFEPVVADLSKGRLYSECAHRRARTGSTTQPGRGQRRGQESLGLSALW